MLAQQPTPLTVAQAKAQYDKTVTRHDNLAMADAAYLLGKRYRAAGDYVSGRKWLLSALRIWEPRGPSVELNRVYVQLVTDVVGVSNFPQAFNYAYRALANSRKLKDPHSLMSAYTCLGGLHWGVAEGQADMHSQWAGEQNRAISADSAVWYFQQAETIATGFSDPKELAIIRQSKGGMLLERDPKKAIPLIVFALSIFEKQERIQSQLNSHLALALAHIKLNQLPEARRHLLAIETISRKSNQLDAHVPVGVYSAWASWHRASGHWQQAYRQLRKADSLKQIAMRTDQQATIARLNVAYEAERRENLLKTQLAQNALQKSELQQQERRNWMVWGLLAVAIVVGFSFYRLSQENKRISIQNTELREEQNHRFSNNLQAISGMLSLQSGRLTDAEARQAIEESGLRIQTMTRLNQKLHDTNRLVALGLPMVIPDVVQSVLESYGYETVRPIYELDYVPLHPDQAIPIAVIINELVTNACKYAFPGNPAPQLQIRCWRDQNQLRLKVQDNGPGVPQTSSMQGFGMYLIALQVRQLDGKFDISGPPGLTFDLSVGIKVKKRLINFGHTDETARANSDR